MSLHYFFKQLKTLQLKFMLQFNIINMFLIEIETIVVVLYQRSKSNTKQLLAGPKVIKSVFRKSVSFVGSKLLKMEVDIFVALI